MPRLPESHARATVYNRTVAIVGNAPEILRHEYGTAIDTHEVVIRMNFGLPRTDELRRTIGHRTDVLTGGKVGPPQLLPRDLDIWWLKHTDIGQRDYKGLMAFGRHGIWHMPVWFKDELYKEMDGVHASSGPLLVYICRRFGASKIDVYGVTCWGQLEPGSTNHWWGKQDKSGCHAHAKEAEWFRKNTRRVGPLHYEVR